MKKLLWLLIALFVFTGALKAQNIKPDSTKSNQTEQRKRDSLAIIQTALDYIDGYYTSDGIRMERALHPELSKRIIMKTDRGEQINQMSALTLIQITKSKPVSPEAKRLRDVFVTDIFRDAATAKIIASDWVDYLQLHRWHGRWVIVNVLWELKK